MMIDAKRGLIISSSVVAGEGKIQLSHLHEHGIDRLRFNRIDAD